jgi:hypothetical protein
MVTTHVDDASWGNGAVASDADSSLLLQPILNHDILVAIGELTYFNY